jgi:hypothetical protein
LRGKKTYCTWIKVGIDRFFFVRKISFEGFQSNASLFFLRVDFFLKSAFIQSKSINIYLRFLLHLIVLTELELFELSIDDFDAEVFLDKLFFERNLLALVLLFFVRSVCF